MSGSASCRRCSKRPSVIYVVSYDHPQYGWGVEFSSWSTRDGALNAVDELIELESFDRKKDFKRKIEQGYNGAITTFSGVGNADGIYYYITRTSLDI